MGKVQKNHNQCLNGFSVYRNVQTFCGESPKYGSLKGGVHSVYISYDSLVNEPLDNVVTLLKKTSKDDSDVIYVLAIVEHNEINAIFIQNGYQIKRCGSGSLAIAYVLTKENIKTAAQYKIHSCGEYLVVGVDQKEGVYIESSPLEMSPVKYVDRGGEDLSQKAWLKVVSSEPIEMFFIGGDFDYCVMVLSDEGKVKNLNVDFAALTRLSNKALIVTARSSGDADYVLRYFAPQYGNNEDNATGSANIQLAPYWQNTLCLDVISGVQLSLSGGAFKVLKTSNGQRLYGNCRMNKMI